MRTPTEEEPIPDAPVFRGVPVTSLHPDDDELEIEDDITPLEPEPAEAWDIDTGHGEAILPVDESQQPDV